MKIMEASIVYSDWVSTNTTASELDKLIARSLLATNDVSTTLFITEATFEHVTKIYSTLKQDTLRHNESESSTKENGSEDNFEVSGTKKRLDRKKAVSYVTKNIMKNNPGAEIINVRYNTLEVKLNKGNKVNVKVSTSRDYNKEDYNPNKVCCSWHKEDDRNISDYDFHIYVVEYGNSYKGLIFDTNELQDHLSKKTYNNYFVNYYFHWNADGSVTDERDTATPIKVTQFDADKTDWKLN